MQMAQRGTVAPAYQACMGSTKQGEYQACMGEYYQEWHGGADRATRHGGAGVGGGGLVVVVVGGHYTK